MKKSIGCLLALSLLLTVVLGIVGSVGWLFNGNVDRIFIGTLCSLIVFLFCLLIGKLIE